MKLRDQYTKLYELMQGRQQPGLPALAEAMHCSERNMRHLLAKMQEQGWLQWTAARGRGHHSQLQLLKTPDALALDHLSGLLARGDLEQAFASLGRAQRKQLASRLPAYLGLSDGKQQLLRMPLYRPIASLDPLHAYGRLEAHLIRQIFSRLLTFDHQQRSLRPVLAHNWESEDEARVWHFWLRPGLSFHDGSELGPEDVKATFLRLRDQYSIYQNLYRHIKRIELGPNQRISFYLQHSDYLWPHCLATAMSSIVPRQRARNFAQFPVGCGAFKVIRNNPYQLSLQAFKSYYREGALLDEIDLWVMQPSAEQAGFDLQFGYDPANARKQQSTMIAESGCTHLICNPAHSLFRSTQQRLAWADWLAPETLFPSDDPARKPAAGLLPGWTHRVARAGECPAFRRGSKLRFVTGQSNEILHLGALIQARLQAAGLEVEWRTVNFKVQMGREWMQECDLYLAREIMHDDQDFGCFEWFSADTLYRRWMPEAVWQQIDQQLRHIQAEPDSASRMPAYARIGQQLVEDGWLIPVSHENHFVSVAPHVAGVRMTPLGFVSFCELWLKDTPEAQHMPAM